MTQAAVAENQNEPPQAKPDDNSNETEGFDAGLRTNIHLQSTQIELPFNDPPQQVRTQEPKQKNENLPKQQASKKSSKKTKNFPSTAVPALDLNETKTHRAPPPPPPPKGPLPFRFPQDSMVAANRDEVQSEGTDVPSIHIPSSADLPEAVGREVEIVDVPSATVEQMDIQDVVEQVSLSPQTAFLYPAMPNRLHLSANEEIFKVTKLINHKRGANGGIEYTFEVYLFRSKKFSRVLVLDEQIVKRHFGDDFNESMEIIYDPEMADIQAAVIETMDSVELPTVLVGEIMQGVLISARKV